MHGNEQVAKTLTDRGADDNEVSPLWDILEIATIRGSKGIMECLVSIGADVNALEHRKAPIYLAAHERRTNIVEHLLAHGADANGCNDAAIPLSWKLLSEAIERSLLCFWRMGQRLMYPIRLVLHCTTPAGKVM